MSSTPLRALPSVERLVQALGGTLIPRPLVVGLVRDHLAALRAAGSPPSFEVVQAALRAKLSALERSRLQPVINATGILAHTNLGRAPLSSSAVSALAALAGGYSNLELDLESGERGGRAAYLERALAHLCEAEAATVVNNCAAALVLILRHHTAGAKKEVLLSRGELVQIGGGFRIPEILETSGARLREVGTTNRTTVDDYRRAIGPDTALVLRVHRSNFAMEGFVESPDASALAALSHEHAVPIVEDLGSGALVDLTSFSAAAPEPQPQRLLRDGIDLVCFSGDKLLGGPQAGIIAGRRAAVAALKKDPLFRALRCDKLVFAALQSTVEDYLRAAARRDAGPPPEVPVMTMLAADCAALRRRAERLAAALAGIPAEVGIVEGRSEIGGGVSPRSVIPSVTLSLRPADLSVDALSSRLRRGRPSVVGYLAEGALRLDLRTVFAEQDDALALAIRNAWATAEIEG